MIEAIIRCGNSSETISIPERLAEVSVAQLLEYEEKAAPLYPAQLQQMDRLNAEIEHLHGRGMNDVVQKRINELNRQLDEIGQSIGSEEWENTHLRPFLLESMITLLRITPPMANTMPTDVMKSLHRVVGRALDTVTESELNVNTWTTMDGVVLELPSEEMKGASFIEFAEAAQLMHLHHGKVWTSAYHVASVLWRVKGDKSPYTEERYFANLERLKGEPATILARTAFFLAVQHKKWLPIFQNYLQAMARAAAKNPTASGGTLHFVP